MSQTFDSIRQSPAEIRVVQLNTFGEGGAAIAALRLHKGLCLTQSGILSHFLAFDQLDTGLPRAKTLLDGLNGWAKLKAEQAFFWKRAWDKQQIKGYSDAGYLFDFPKALLDITKDEYCQQADLLHFHWMVRFLDYKSFFKKNTKKIVWTIHDMYPFSGGYAYESVIDQVEYASLISKNVEKKKRYLAQADITVVSPSKWLMEKSQNSELFGRFPHYHIPNAVDTDIFAPMDRGICRQVLGLPQDANLLLFVAEKIRDTRKGFAYLQAILPRLLSETDYHVCVLGASANLPLQHGRIHWKGKVKDERLMAMFYAAADLFVIPSIEDNFPNTTIEALCCGLPVVGFPVGGIPEAVQHDFVGRVAEEVSENALLEAIMSAYRASFDKLQIAHWAHDRFALSVQAEKVAALYRQILSS